MKTTKEGFVKTSHGKVWYKIVGKGEKTPLIVVHGGPGHPHNYLEPLEDLADERPVIFYDQLGCGKSVNPDDPEYWTVEYFTKEALTLIDQLKLNAYHIFGHSWGAALAVEVALQQPKGLKSIILADPYISSPVWIEDAERLIKTLPKNIQVLLKSNPNSEAFRRASEEYYNMFVYRMDERPQASRQSSALMNRRMYTYMWGIREFAVSGTLQDYDLIPELHKIQIPTLLASGRYDEATPEALEIFQKQIPKSEVAVFENSAHFPFWTDRKAFIETVSQFLKNAE